MIISYETEELLDSCNRIQAAEQLLGRPHAEALIARIAEAEAFDHAGALISFLGPEVAVAQGDSLFVAIGSHFRARLVPIGRRFARDNGGRIDWASVQRLKLVELARSQ